LLVYENLRYNKNKNSRSSDSLYNLLLIFTLINVNIATYNLNIFDTWIIRTIYQVIRHVSPLIQINKIILCYVIVPRYDKYIL